MSDTEDERELRDRATVERVMERHLSIVKGGEDSIGDDHDEDSLAEHPLNVEIEKSDESLTTPKHGLFSDRTKSGDLGDTISFFNNGQGEVEKSNEGDGTIIFRKDKDGNATQSEDSVELSTILEQNSQERGKEREIREKGIAGGLKTAAQGSGEEAERQRTPGEVFMPTVKRKASDTEGGKLVTGVKGTGLPDGTAPPAKVKSFSVPEKRERKIVDLTEEDYLEEEGDSESNSMDTEDEWEKQLRLRENLDRIQMEINKDFEKRQILLNDRPEVWGGKLAEYREEVIEDMQEDSAMAIIVAAPLGKRREMMTANDYLVARETIPTRVWQVNRTMEDLEYEQEKKGHYHPGKVWKTIRALLTGMKELHHETLVQLFGGEMKYQEVLKEVKALEKLLSDIKGGRVSKIPRNHPLFHVDYIQELVEWYDVMLMVISELVYSRRVEYRKIEKAKIYAWNHPILKMPEEVRQAKGLGANWSAKTKPLRMTAEMWKEKFARDAEEEAPTWVHTKAEPGQQRVIHMDEYHDDFLRPRPGSDEDYDEMDMEEMDENERVYRGLRRDFETHLREKQAKKDQEANQSQRIRAKGWKGNDEYGDQPSANEMMKREFSDGGSTQGSHGSKRRKEDDLGGTESVTSDKPGDDEISLSGSSTYSGRPGGGRTETFRQRMRRDVVVAYLKKHNKNYDALADAILDMSVPFMNYMNETKRGGEQALVGKFKSMGMDWRHGTFNLREHFRMLDLSLDMNGVSSKQRIKMLIYTGGFSKEAEKDKKISSWKQKIMLRLGKVYERVRYDMNEVAESDFEYWTEMWIRVKMDIIVYFWQRPNEREIEKNLVALMEKTAFVEGDTLNNAAHRLLEWYNEATDFQKNTGSERADHGYWLMDKFREILRKKGILGSQLERILWTRIDLVVEDPAKNLPANHGFLDDELAEMYGKSANKLTEEVYRVILRGIDEDGHANKLNMIIQEEKDFTLVSRKKSSSSSSSGKTMVVNNVKVTPKPAGGGGSSSGGGDKTKQENSCGDCGLYCHKREGKCAVFKNKKISVKDLLKMNNSMFKPQGGGRWTLHNGMQDKLQRFGFPRMGIQGEDVKPALIEIQKGITDLWEASKDSGGKAVVNNVSTTSVTAAEAEAAALLKKYKKLERENQELKKAKSKQEEDESDDDSDDEDSGTD